LLSTAPIAAWQAANSFAARAPPAPPGVVVALECVVAVEVSVGVAGDDAGLLVVGVAVPDEVEVLVVGVDDEPVPLSGTVAVTVVVSVVVAGVSVVVTVDGATATDDVAVTVAVVVTVAGSVGVVAVGTSAPVVESAVDAAVSAAISR
jgi:hypothetical protein